MRGVSRAAAVAVVAFIALGFSIPAFANSDFRCEQAADIAGNSNGGSQSALGRIRLKCPLLGHIIEEFALRDLGEVESIEGVGRRTHEIAILAAAAALGDPAATRFYAKYALDAGATRLELEEMLYLTAVDAGFSKAIEATRALSDLLIDAPQNRCPDRSVSTELQGASNSLRS